MGDYAVFAAGFETDTAVDIYDNSLTRTNNLSLSKGRYQTAAATVGNYGLFVGGLNDSSVVDIFKLS